MVYTGPGDAIGTNLFTAFWGFRAFSAASIGTRAAVQLRRLTDNAVGDFGTLANGTLDAASIAAFARGANLTIATMYDQTGNGNHLVPTDSSFEQAFTPNTLNGMGVYDNHLNNATAYRVNTTFTIVDTWSNCFYNVYKAQPSFRFQFMSLCDSGDNELGLVAERDAAFNTATIKNEGGGFNGGITNKTVPDNVWHAVVGVIDQNPEVGSFIYVDNQVPNPNAPAFTGPFQYNGDPNNLFATICMWGEDGNGPNTNMLQGYGAEGAWFATPTPNQPWTIAQAAALIANAQGFWFGPPIPPLPSPAIPAASDNFIAAAANDVRVAQQNYLIFPNPYSFHSLLAAHQALAALL